MSIHPHDWPTTRDELVAALLDAVPRLRVVANFAVGLFIPEAGYDPRLAREAGGGLGCRLWMRDRRAVGLYAVRVPRTRVSFS